MAKYRGVDFLLLDDELAQEERLARDAVRAFVQDNVVPVIEDCYEQGRFPLELVPKMGELGLFAPTLPAEYGCAGANYVTYGLMMQELERGDSGVRSFASVQGSLCMYPIYTFGTGEQKRRWMPLMASGRAVGCFGLTEPDHGSDPASMITRARKTDRGFVLNGNKMWITNGSLADVAIVWAKLDGDVRGFLVEKGTPGFTTSDIKRKMSLRASVTSELAFDDCEIPEENMLPGAEGLKAPLSCLNQARFGIAWGGTGAAMACYDAALAYALQRTQFGRPIAGFQLVQRKLARMLTEITKAQLVNLRVGRLLDAGRARHPHISLAKMNALEHALDAARTARDILGAAGITLEHPVMRHLCNLESVKTYEGTHDIHELILGRDITGIQAFS
jgi:glutaryl-CoA dehydrogenase